MAVLENRASTVHLTIAKDLHLQETQAYFYRVENLD